MSKTTNQTLVRVGFGQLHVELDGPQDAPAVTLLHSLATSGALWAAEAAALSQHYRVLRIDARGHGGSDVPAAPYAFDDLAADVVAVWDALGIARSAVIGLSMGGMTAFGLALRHPGRVSRILAADCRADAPDFFRAMWDGRRKLLAEQGMEAVADATLPTWLTEATRTNRPDLVERVRAMILATDPDGYRGATAALQQLDYKRRLAEIRVPATLVVGAQDGPHPAEMRAMADLIPGVRFVEIAAAAHLANLERPEAFMTAITAFLAETPELETLT
jgi:3-oxoadipate enol-lactonase